MRITLDTVQVSLWALAYLTIIINYWKHHNLAIPMDALILNSAWEINALLSGITHNQVFVGHIIWLSLDMVILFFSYKEKPRNQKLIFGLVHIVCIITLYILFKHGFMLHSVFLIDLLMAISYLQFVMKNKVSPNFLTFLICIFEFAGDLVAFLFYKSFEDFVLYAGLIVQVLHVIRLIFFFRPKKA